jgi:ankyrin repeat protein
MNKNIFKTKDAVLSQIINNNQNKKLKEKRKFVRETYFFYAIEKTPKLFEERDEYGNTLLHYMVIEDQGFHLDLCLSKGINIEIENNYGLTPIDYSNLFEFETTNAIVNDYLSCKRIGLKYS